MIKTNDFLKYTVKLNIEYENYFRLIYETKYLLEARLGPDKKFLAYHSIYANSRRKAVKKAVQWFWKEFKGLLGSANEVMTVDDPHCEVVYDDDFACNDLGNKYLEEDIIEQIIEESNGELIRDTSKGSENHPPNCFKRVKRRRKKNALLAPRITQTPGGAIFYRMTEAPQVTEDGKIVQRRKIKNVKLSSKSLDKALREIARRKLDRHEDADVEEDSINGNGDLKEAA